MPNDTLDESNLDEVVAKLAALDSRERARAPQPRPGEALPDLVEKQSHYDLARRVYERRALRLLEIERNAETVAGELLPPLPSGAEGPEAVLRRLQHQLLRHPIAFRAAFAALAAEGRRFAETPAGAVWSERLRSSPMLPDIRLLLKMVSLQMLDEQEPELLPSAYLDALFRTVSSGDTDAVLNRLFGGRVDASEAR